LSTPDDTNSHQIIKVRAYHSTTIIARRCTVVCC
jgi:hypothetical protein